MVLDLKSHCLTDFGRMNRSNRVYFRQLLAAKAKALSLGTAELSGYEVGRAELPIKIENAVRDYWAERKCKIVIE